MYNKRHTTLDLVMGVRRTGFLFVFLPDEDLAGADCYGGVIPDNINN